MDTAQWPQEEIMVKPIEDKVSNTNSNNNNNNNNKVGSTSLERKVRPKQDEGANCPRCNSSNTKFCYYNNYSLTQPRYFCKACKRYWTAGGSLRNIPVGGASRKNKRSSSSCFTSSSPPSSKRISSHDLVAAAQTQYLNSNPNNNNNNNNNKIHAQDLNLGFPTSQHLHQQQFTNFSEFIQLPSMVVSPTNNPKEEQGTDNQHYHHLSALELLNGLTSSSYRSLTPFIPMAIPDPNNEGEYSSGYPSLQEYRPSLNFSLDGIGNGYDRLQVQEQGHVENNGGRLLFPFEDLNQVSSTTVDGGADHNNTTTTTTNNNNSDNNNSNEEEQIREEHGDSTNGYWSGMLDAGGSW